MGEEEGLTKKRSTLEKLGNVAMEPVVPALGDLLLNNDMVLACEAAATLNRSGKIIHLFGIGRLVSQLLSSLHTRGISSIS